MWYAGEQPWNVPPVCTGPDVEMSWLHFGTPASTGCVTRPEVGPGGWQHVACIVRGRRVAAARTDRRRDATYTFLGISLTEIRPQLLPHTPCRLSRYLAAKYVPNHLPYNLLLCRISRLKLYPRMAFRMQDGFFPLTINCTCVDICVHICVREDRNASL